jgi:transposase
VIADELIDTLAPQQLRQALRTAQQIVLRQEREVAFKQATIDKLTHEMAVLKRLKFAAKSEGYNDEQKSLIEETRTGWRAHTRSP